jgi:beta-glucosidase
MMIKLYNCLFISLLFVFTGVKAQTNNYLNPKLPIDTRVEMLVKSMTLDEKVMQLQNRSFSLIQKYLDNKGDVNIDSLKKLFPNGVGGINIDINLDPATYVKVGNQLQKFSLGVGKGIPMMFVGEGLHGYMSKGATSFPQAIALGCSWDTVLAERVFTATALEARTRGVRVILSPVLDLGREPRFGRIEEMYSEDPYLVSEIGKAAVNGFQGRSNTPDSMHVAAILKHFVGHGEPEGGRNTAPVNISTYDLLNAHLYPFEQIIKCAKPMGVMPSYNEINGIPNHANYWLLSDVLRKQLKFDGILLSDQNAVDELYRQHAYVPTAEDAAQLAITNGIDVDIEYFTGTYTTLGNLVKSGKLQESVIDNALRKALKIKFTMGLFENPYSDVDKMLAVTNSVNHKKLAQEAAEKSMVLLKNENNLLPFNSNSLKTVAVIGPLAKGIHFGGYSAEPRVGTDVLDGITQFGKGKFNVVYAEGCKLALEEGSFWGNIVHTPNSDSDDRRLINEAVEVARNSDVIVLAIGENESFSREAWGENHRGDRSDLNLIGLQNELVQQLLGTGKPIVAVMFGGRPLSFNFVAKNVPAIIQAYYLGQETGTALANVLFGLVNPSGKLSVTIPKSVGELPCFYNRKPLRMRSYINEENAPLFPFGFGLSYTTFEYSKPKISKTTMGKSESVTVTVDVKNTGKFAGEEIVQLYIRDLVSTGVRPIMELRDFSKILLKQGETKTITFVITPEKLKFYNYKLQKVLEPGEFKVMIGPGSQKVQSLTFTVN